MTGRVRLSDYKQYIEAFGGWHVAVFLVFLLVLAQAVSIGSSYWLSIWSGSGLQPDPGFPVYFSVYVCLGTSSVMFTGL